MSDMVQATAAPAAARVSDAYRWTQLAIGVAAMVMIANYQYGWTFFVPDIQKTFGWDRASIQWAFTLFVLFETWLVPVEGWFVDKYGPRLVVLIGGCVGCCCCIKRAVGGPSKVGEIEPTATGAVRAAAHFPIRCHCVLSGRSLTVAFGELAPTIICSAS